MSPTRLIMYFPVLLALDFSCISSVWRGIFLVRLSGTRGSVPFEMAFPLSPYLYGEDALISVPLRKPFEHMWTSF